MYSGSTMTVFSARLIGAHQKIDRLARRNLERLAPHSPFPDTHSILHFEGRHGPDAIKRKSPAKDEPWHYLKPFDRDDTQLIDLIERHYKQLVSALKAKDQVRASFEAAWLADAGAEMVLRLPFTIHTKKNLLSSVVGVKSVTAPLSVRS